jgi:DNA repair exonuclease SbcCD nuclease subunit
MKYVFLVLLISSSVLFGISIYDIQYTTNPGGGTYPSPYEGQIVTTGGIVSGIDYNNNHFFICSSSGSPWNGIYVYDNEQNVAVGDSVIIEAEVYEYYGFTELTNLEYCNIISSGNQLPEPVITTTQNADSQENLESVLIEIHDVYVTQTYDEYGEWKISDGSESCYIGIGFFDLQEFGFPLVLDYPFAAVKGIMSFEWGEFKLNCRSLGSIQSAPEAYVISIPQQYVLSPVEFDIPINLSFLGEQQQTSSYQFTLNYDDSILEYSGYDLEGTLSSGGTLQVDQSTGSISATFSGDFSFSQIQTLLKLNFAGLESGIIELEITDFSINNINVNYFSIEEIILQMESLPIGDTLTVIQKPILNIPAIVEPGDELPIECLADASTTGWNATLQHQEKVIQLSLISSIYNSDLDRWQLIADVPTPDIYELYDLIVGANEIETDTSQNAVQIIPEFKDEYYFIHITDAHLPTHILYPDPLSLVDTTEVNDFREVVRDINLIKPEFVLLTGDLVNEGEMEDFENRRVYTKAQQLLSEFEVPVYLTSGNHDIGGWDSSPPPQGTARRNWWKFFGWNRLENPPAADPYYTQNYSFDYGDLHFIGMEAYNNYDSFMYNIYGSDSFTDGQMQWLENDIQEHSNSLANVVFYHYDFTEQINLVNLGVDMALWGHIHSNSGNLTSPPFDISTESTCDENRAYRIIYVDDAELIPTETIYAGWSGSNLQTTFTPYNNGEADSVFCYIQNLQSLSFSEAEIKFIMPGGADEYTTFGGEITQIDESGEFAVCYVSFEIPANGNVSVSVKAELVVSAENKLLSQVIQISNYPNPFNPTTTIKFQLNTETAENTELMICNLKGQKVKILNCHPEFIEGSVVWDGTDQDHNPVSSGIYFYKLNIPNSPKGKMLLLK